MTPPVLQACLNGARRAGEHDDLPVRADDLAAQAAAAWHAGAHGVHVHPRDPAGEETLAPGACAEAVAAIRAAAPQLEVGLTTGAWIAGDALACVEAWTVLPDVASVNLAEPGAFEVARALGLREVGVEAGIASEEEAQALGDVARYCARVLVEVPDADPEAAVARARRIDALVAPHGLPRLWHGTGRATWAVLVAACREGHSVRVGLEDTLEWPDGRPAPSNEAMVRAASEIQRRAAR